MPAAETASVVPAGPAPALAGALRRELTLWTILAIGSLGMAGLFALLLAFSRIPGSEAVFPWPSAFFHKGLVIHVVFSFVVWFLAVFGALSVLALARFRGDRIGGEPSAAQRWLGLAAAAGAIVATPLLFVPALLDRGVPTLNNYVPVIIDPLYYAGLALLAVCITLAAARLLAASRPTRLRGEPVAGLIAASALACLLAALCFVLALAALGDAAPSHDFNENLTWGGGHVLQFTNTLLLIAAWCLLAAPFASGLPVAALAVASAVLLLGAALAPALYTLLAPFSPWHVLAFTWLQYLFGPAALIAAAPLALRIRRPWPWRETGFLALALSWLLFATGGTMGLFVDGADTRTPAHYHGVIASITVAFFAVFFTRLLPALNRLPPAARRQRLILLLFALGQWVACIGLFIAGGHGAPRKVAGEAQGLTDVAAMVGMGLNGLGGLVAVAGGILFVWSIAATLLRPSETTVAPANRHLTI